VSSTPESRRGTNGRVSSAREPEQKWALPLEVEHWSMTKPQKNLIKIGAKVVHHSRYITFQLAEVAIPRDLFAEILRLIGRLRPAPLPP
ncbi:MAG: hypothetical protein O7B79_14550, partial [SAR324 cluster bacterium]|nr:hypothetical protein [SAR324 cluster bacterium]